MPESEVLYLYRRLLPKQTATAIHGGLETAFTLREGENELPVFDSSIVTPRSTLQKVIDAKKKSAEEGDSKAIAFLDRCPDVKTLISREKWGVLRITRKFVEKLGLVISASEPDGHCEILMNAEENAKFRLAVNEAMARGEIVLVTIEECLAE